MIGELLISPYLIIVVTLILWLILFQIFYRIIQLKERNWKRLEYAWLFIGLFGLISVVADNKKQYHHYQSENSANYIKILCKELQSTLNGTQTCFQFIRSEYSPANFDDLQHDQNLICSWSKTFQLNLDSSNSIPKNNLEKINVDELNLKSDGMMLFINEFNSSVEAINSEIKEYTYHLEIYHDQTWEHFTKSFGVLMLSIAFAIRLSIATKNVVQCNKKK